MGTNRIEVPAGDRHGNLVVLRELPSRSRKSGGTQRFVLCRCDCGKETEVRLKHLLSGHTQSCGRHPNPGHGDDYHGMAGSPEYGVWLGMKRRCRRPKARDYGNYGGRGVRVCERWRKSFKAFFEDMGARPSPEHSIDRIDGEGDYEPGNCKWSTRREQNRHRRDNRFFEFNGEKLCLTDWAKRYGMRKVTLHDRLARGMSIEAALTKPVRKWVRQTN